MMNWNGHALVTGASSGIGLAVTTLLLERGAHVTAVSRTPGGLKPLLDRFPGHARWVRADVTSPADLRTVADSLALSKPISWLVPNAGIARVADSSDLDAFDEQWHVNGRAALQTFETLRPLLASSASVVFVSTFLRSITFPGLAGYIASKAALSAYVRTRAVEMASRGVRMNLVSPGPTATAIWGQVGLSPEEVQMIGGEIEKRMLHNRFLDAEEIAETILFLLSPASRGTIGQDHIVDGGFTLR